MRSCPVGRGRGGCGAVRLGAMGESDWWLCGQCRSLNNLSAGKCYSCHRSKPKDSQRASAFLGYEPVVTRDGKVRLDFPTPSADEPASDALAAASQIVPLRDPIPRSITDVAPRVPHGARIVYRLHEPPMPPRPTRPPMGHRPPFAPGPPMGPAAPHPRPGSRGLASRSARAAGCARDAACHAPAARGGPVPRPSASRGHARRSTCDGRRARRPWPPVHRCPGALARAGRTGWWSDPAAAATGPSPRSPSLTPSGPSWTVGVG